MSTVLTPPAPKDELDELCLLFGSTGAAARFLGRERAQIARWRKGTSNLHEDSIELIDVAWNAARLIVDLVGAERIGTVVHQRWSALDGRTPAECVRAGRPDDLLDVLRGATGVAVERDDRDVDEEIANWFAANLVAHPASPAPIPAADEDDDDDDEFATAAPLLDDSWRGGRSMSSDRWFKR